jgi:hypothetical protein
MEHNVQQARATRPISYLFDFKLRLCLRLVLFGARQPLFGLLTEAVGLKRSAPIRGDSRRHEARRPRRRGTQNATVNSAAQTQKNDVVALAKKERHILINISASGGRRVMLAAREWDAQQRVAGMLPCRW